MLPADRLGVRRAGGIHDPRGKGRAIWLFTEKGFYSVVTTDLGGDYMIRGRVLADLEALLPILEPFGRSRSVIVSESADYRYRLVVDTDEWLRIAEVLAAELDYTNFKNRIAARNPRRASAYHRIWDIHFAELSAEDADTSS